MTHKVRAALAHVLALALALATIALPSALVYGAANRSIITVGPATMATVAADVNEELTVLYANGTQLTSSVSGTNTITASLTPTLTSYVSGMSVWLTPANNNTTAATLNLNGLGTKPVVSSANVALSSGDLTAGTRYLLSYDGTSFRIIGSASSGAPSSAEYVTISTNGTLTNERVLTAGTGITITDAGAGSTVTIAPTTNGIADTMLRQSVANSVVGRANNSTGNVADISCGTDGHALRLSGTTLGCGTLAAGALGANIVGDAALRQGTARTVIGRSANSTGNVADISGGGAGTYLSDNGTSLSFTTFSTISADLNLTGDITPTQLVANTNNYAPTSFSTSAIVKISTDASRNITGLAAGTDGRVIIMSNVGSFDAVLKNQDALSTAGNRFSIGGDVTLQAGNSIILVYDATSSRWLNASDTIHAAAGGGEANTASNVGSAGVGVFKTKSVVDLQFKNINTTSGQGITVVDDTGNNEIDVNLSITGLTAESTPDPAADYLPCYDASAATNDKCLVGLIGSGSKTIYVPAAAMTSQTTNGCVDGTSESTTNKVMTLTKDCDGATQEGVQFMVGMPKSAAETTVTARVDWTAASGTGDVIWLVSCLARSNDDAIDTAFGTEISVTDTVLTALDVHQSPETAAVTPGGTWAENDNLWCRVQRDADAAGDTLNAIDARLLGVRFLYTTTTNTDD